MLLSVRLDRNSAPLCSWMRRSKRRSDHKWSRTRTTQPSLCSAQVHESREKRSTKMQSLRKPTLVDCHQDHVHTIHRHELPNCFLRLYRGRASSLVRCILSCLQGGNGKQVLSGMRTNQATTLGFGKRFQYDFVKRAKEQPGAGEYVKDSNACGKQHLSVKKSMPLYSFGTSDRDQAAKMFLSKEHEKGQSGNMSPGPTTAQQVYSFQRLFEFRNAAVVHVVSNPVSDIQLACRTLLLGNKSCRRRRHSHAAPLAMLSGLERTITAHHVHLARRLMQHKCTNEHGCPR